MTCVIAERATHRALAETLAADPRVATVDILAPDEDASGAWTTECTLVPGETRVPPTLLRAIGGRGMGVVEVTSRAAFDHLRVCIR